MTLRDRLRAMMAENEERYNFAERTKALEDELDAEGLMPKNKGGRPRKYVNKPSEYIQAEMRIASLEEAVKDRNNRILYLERRLANLQANSSPDVDFRKEVFDFLDEFKRWNFSNTGNKLIDEFLSEHYD